MFIFNFLSVIYFQIFNILIGTFIYFFACTSFVFRDVAACLHDLFKCEYLVNYATSCLSKTTCSPRCSNWNCCTLKSGFVFYTEFLRNSESDPLTSATLLTVVCWLKLLCVSHVNLTFSLYWFWWSVSQMLCSLGTFGMLRYMYPHMLLG